VLEVIYLIFNEGYSATSGGDWMRPALCDQALRLGRVLAELATQEPEVHGLVALMEIQASRAKARTGPVGRTHLAAGAKPRALGPHPDTPRLCGTGARRGLGGALGPYALQAAIAACHARAPTGADTDWQRIAALYDALAQLMPSPVVELNRAVALAMAFGPATGLEVADALLAEPLMKNYHLLPSVRADFLFKLGRLEEAHAEFERAASLTRNLRERELLFARCGLQAGRNAAPRLTFRCGLRPPSMQAMAASCSSTVAPK
jgi:predicted RNA polymerase sigma factor